MASLRALVGKLIFTQGTVLSTTTLTPHFRCLEVGAQTAPSPGDKVQVLLDEGMRTYTPFGFDASKRSMQLLAWLHAKETPGARWASDVGPGASVTFFGPRRSLRLEALTGQVVVFGDETSFAVARSLFDTGRATVRGVFEVSEPGECATVLDTLGLKHRTLLSRTADLRHLDEAVNAIAASSPAHLVLTGNAKSIQRLRAKLKQTGLTMPQLTKAYWAEGKRGLD